MLAKVVGSALLGSLAGWGTHAILESIEKLNPLATDLISTTIGIVLFAVSLFGIFRNQIK
jgi:hypothetical protein